MGRADAGAGPLPRLEVALGGELPVGVDDDAARHAELAGQDARGRQRGPDREAAGANRAAQLALELLAQSPARRPVQRDEQVGREAEFGVEGIGLLLVALDWLLKGAK